MRLETLWLSLDPYMRGRMNAARPYVKPVDIGEVMTGQAICRIESSPLRLAGGFPGLGAVWPAKRIPADEIRYFIVHDFAQQTETFHREMDAWVAGGRVRFLEHRIEGLEAAPQAPIEALSGVRSNSR